MYSILKFVLGHPTQSSIVDSFKFKQETYLRACVNKSRLYRILHKIIKFSKSLRWNSWLKTASNYYLFLLFEASTGWSYYYLFAIEVFYWSLPGLTKRFLCDALQMIWLWIHAISSGWERPIVLWYNDFFFLPFLFFLSLLCYLVLYWRNYSYHFHYVVIVLYSSQSHVPLLCFEKSWS